MKTELRIGDRVYDRADHRHIGLVEQVSCGQVKVRWEETGWISYMLLKDVRRAPEAA